MDLNWLKPLLGRPAPFTTVYIDATPAEAAGSSESSDRWKAVRRELEHQGAPTAVLDEIGDRVARPARVAGSHGRVLIADAEGVRVDRVLAEPPAQSLAVCGPAPALLPAARAADESTRYLLVEVDRLGADLTWSEGSGLVGPPMESIEGGHDVLHKTHDGGTSQRRLATRAEDSWERNAQVVAAELDRVVGRRHPELVLLTGDVRAVALVRDAVGQRVREMLIEVPGGSRADGIKQEVFAARVAKALADHRTRRRELVLDLFRTQQGRGGSAVTELGDVVDVLRRGQVRELVLAESVAGASSPLAERELWVGPEPLQVALSRADLATMGVEEGARTLRADIALMRAALGQDAGLTFAEDGAVDLVDGVGALLRWNDGSTPRESVLSQSGDRSRLRNSV
ncbi:MAG TPA: Vms1/Ankzf1 family peptidyl-tRNA hydrolase [Cellulomonas sp.]|uniref:baeRF2 domain-containing protein n=1 Tax=Cellulomonas sp. TaxID=40001 RepID=UPI002E2F32BC|nr:Vms1/Ankzf1 family peptidyl-tRNA hydrolase [Cellulomonas sp.]HEX5334170.1 Vms1/Ankzf1 family peptidyl-tRNA hydrolase [Cellulomonas sp.]